MSKSTVESILASLNDKPRFISTCYPYIYACDMLRQHPEIAPAAAVCLAQERAARRGDVIGIGSTWSRSDASQIREDWAAIEDRADEELAAVLADVYLQLNGIIR